MNFGIQKSIRKLNRDRNPSVIEENPDRKLLQFFSIDRRKSFKNNTVEEILRKNIRDERVAVKENELAEQEEYVRAKYEKYTYGWVLPEGPIEYISQKRLRKMMPVTDQRKGFDNIQLRYIIAKNAVERTKNENTLALENKALYDTYHSKDDFQNEIDDQYILPNTNKPIELSPFMKEEIEEMKRAESRRLQRVTGAINF